MNSLNNLSIMFNLEIFEKKKINSQTLNLRNLLFFFYLSTFIYYGQSHYFFPVDREFIKFNLCFE